MKKYLNELNKEQLKHFALTLRIIGGASLGFLMKVPALYTPLLLLIFAVCELSGGYLLGLIEDEE